MFGGAKKRVLKGLGLYDSSRSNTDRTRLASFPFISGDTFRSMAGTVWEKDGGILRRCFGRGIFFVDAHTSVRPGWIDELHQHVEEKIDFTPHAMIIHNDDKVPNAEELERLAAVVGHVFCVNVPDGIEGVTPIPLGLENAWYNKSGRLRYYLDRAPRGPNGADWNRLVVSSFSIGTNKAKREPIARLMESSRHGHQGMVWQSGEFREVISKSLFVISPPGNGADAHRTWESIYLGAVPVVERGYLAKSLVDDLPILAVDRYEDFLDLSDAELISTYQEIRQKPVDKAYSPYWVQQVLGQASV